MSLITGFSNSNRDIDLNDIFVMDVLYKKPKGSGKQLSNWVCCAQYDFALSAIELLREVHTESITAELGYMYALEAEDIVLPPDRKDLQYEYAFNRTKTIQLKTATSVMNLITILTKPLTRKYSDNFRYSINLPNHFCDMLYEIEKEKFISDDDFKSLALMVHATLSGMTATDASDMAYNLDTKRMCLKRVLEILVPHLHLQEYDFNSVRDYAAFMEYTSCRNLPKICDILYAIYGMFIPFEVARRRYQIDSDPYDTDFTAQEKRRNMNTYGTVWVSTIPCKSPEFVCSITKLINYEGIKQVSKSTTTVSPVDCYLKHLYCLHEALANSSDIGAEN